jgi:hypothetical protein
MKYLNAVPGWLVLLRQSLYKKQGGELFTGSPFNQ